MHPTLVKLQVTSKTLIPHATLRGWLSANAREDLMPEKRCPSDAVRVAASYVLRDWQQWRSESKAYRVIVSSPTDQKGLWLQVDVQVRDSEKVEYRTQVCTIRADAKDADAVVNEPGPGWREFSKLYDDLNVERLMTLGVQHAFEQDVRRVAQALLSEDATALWPGVWLQLAPSEALKLIGDLATLTIAGELRVRHLTIDQSAANRQMLADELAGEYVKQFERLAKRLELARPNIPAIEQDYMKLAKKLQQAEDMLGVPIACLQEQMAFEEKLGAA